jgi:hypothetical protein
MKTASLFTGILQLVTTPATLTGPFIGGMHAASYALKNCTCGTALSPAFLSQFALNIAPPFVDVTEQLSAVRAGPQVFSMHFVQALNISGAACRIATIRVEKL